MTRAKDIAESIKALKGRENAIVENLKKDEPIKSKRGGRRENSGRKTKEETLVAKGIHQLVEEHVNEKIPVQTTVGGKVVTILKPRVLIVMQRLFAMGETSHEAAGKWMDRALGKPIQPIEHAFDKDKPLRISVDV